MLVADPWLRVSVERVELPDGRIVDEYYQIALPDYAVVVAFTRDDRVVVERAYKHGPRRVFLCLPAGVIAVGEEPLAAAQRELLEETGYRAERWRSLGAYTVNANYGCGRAHLFMARNAVQVATADSGDLEEMEIGLVTMDELLATLVRGEIEMLGTAAALALAARERQLDRTHERPATP